MKILLLTAHFPSYDCPEKSYATPFLYNYAKEWVKMGNEVHVVHFCRKYPLFFNHMADLAAKLGYTKLKRYVVDKEAQTEKIYDYNGVIIHRIPFMKYIPHGKLSRGAVGRLSKKTRVVIDDMGIPNLVIGDCIDPVLNIIMTQRDILKSKILQIMHDSDFVMLKKKELSDKLKLVDDILLRSKKQLPVLESYIGEHKYSYMYSGIPEKVINGDFVPRTRIRKLVYVGALYKSKGLETILRALPKVKKMGFELEVIGDGVDRQYFENITKEINVDSIVNFWGKVPHDEVFAHMKKADALLLISHETFGMVYVEAMSQGCIPIGAINEGIDGVVENGKNGFLLKLGDSVGLANLLEDLSITSIEKIQKISSEAYITAINMTEKKLAEELVKRY